MSRTERVPRLLGDLAETLEAAAELVARGRESFDTDLAVSLTFEAVSSDFPELHKLVLSKRTT